MSTSDEWRRKLKETQMLLQEKLIDYSRILLMLSDMPEVLPNDLRQQIRDFCQQVQCQQDEERARLQNNALEICENSTASFEEKKDAVRAALDPRLYFYEHDHPNPTLVVKQVILTDPCYPERLKSLFNYIDFKYINDYLEQIIDTIPYDKAAAWINNKEAEIEPILFEARNNAELNDLVPDLERTLARLRAKKDWLARYLSKRDSGYVLKRPWSEVINENIRKGNAGLVGEYRNGQYVDLFQETETMRREYAIDCFAAALEKFTNATGLALQEWRSGKPVLNPERPLAVIIKDLKIGLIMLEPSKYQFLFPEVEIIGERSIDPRPIDLDMERANAFEPLLQALNEALAIAQDIQEKWAHRYSDKLSDEEKLERSYFICSLYPSKEIHNYIDDYESLMRHTLDREAGFVWQCVQDRSLTLETIKAFRARLETNPLFCNKQASHKHQKYLYTLLLKVADWESKIENPQ